MTTHEILIAARKRIEKPENWRQGMMRHEDEKQAPYCAGAAIWAEDEKLYPEARKFMERQLFISSLVVWNDAPERTHAEVLAAFDAAIAATSHE